MSYLDTPFVFFLEEAGCYLVSSVTTTQAFQLLWWEIRQTCILLTTHPNTPQRGNRAGGGKLCCLPRGTVLNGLHFCLSACSCISHSECGQAKPTTCLKAIVPKSIKEFTRWVWRIAHKPQSLLATNGGCHYLHCFGWANRKMLPAEWFWPSDEKRSVITILERGKTVTSLFSLLQCAQHLQPRYSHPFCWTHITFCKRNYP